MSVVSKRTASSGARGPRAGGGGADPDPPPGTGVCRAVHRAVVRIYIDDIIVIVQSAQLRSVHGPETITGPVGGGFCPPLPSAYEPVAARVPARQTARTSRTTQTTR